jgi:RNA recognition motif-containing protein
MAKKLYVGGLSYETSQQTLQDLFAQAGTVTSATIIIDRMTQRSKGFGFVEMSTDEESQKAISMFNGKELDGRTITVNEARPQEPRSDRGGFNRNSGRGGYGGRSDGGYRR